MALGEDYITLEDLKSRIGLDPSDTEEDTELNQAITAASRSVEDFCRRQFNQTTTATPRVYRPLSTQLVFVDDFHTETDLVVETDNDADGTFETTISASEYQLEPLNGVREGTPGWPYWRVRLLGSTAFSLEARRATVQVTAQWGWDEIPTPIKDATMIAAEELYKLKDAPYGVANWGEFGPMRVRNNPRVAQLLRPYSIGKIRIERGQN